MCDSDPLAEYAQEEEPVDLMQRAQVKYFSYNGRASLNVDWLI